MKTPTLKRVLRLDTTSLDQTYFTEEGYLIDHPIVTSVGIFEYALPKGGVRRELRLPEHVFDPESLASYEGKPIIITHDVGEVDKNNVEQEGIGTILTKGYRDGDDVRAKIIIHDTDAMRGSNLRELSLGYTLDLLEKPGEWNGQPYDAIQTNIRINHLALVGNARAGDQARLNVDSRDQTLKGAKMTMSKKTTNKDGGPLSPEELAKAVEAFKARRATRMAAHSEPDGDEGPNPALPPDGDGDENIPAADEGGAPAAPAAEGNGEGASAEEQTQMVKDRRDRRDSDGDPENLDSAMNCIAQQDEDIETLLGIIDAMCAGHGDGEEPPAAAEEEPENKDSDDGKAGALNADSVDAIVRERVKLARIGDRLNMDGIDGMGIMAAKKAIVGKLKPTLRLDGKSTSYVNAAFDLALSEMGARKDTNFQRKQMFNGDGRAPAKATSSASEARQKMIERKTMNGGKE